jgi:nucleotide-binding universal stress UspA family protein
MFEKILVAVDERETGTAATRFASQLSGTFHASVQVFHPEAASARSSRSGDRQLAQAVAAEAQRVHADLIVLGLDRQRIGRHHLVGSVREQLAQLTQVPVMAAPTGFEVAQTDARERKHGRLTKRLTHV